MNDIRITPAAQIGILATLAAAVLALVAAQLPELRRYMKIRSM